MNKIVILYYLRIVLFNNGNIGYILKVCYEIKCKIEVIFWKNVENRLEIIVLSKFVK